MSEIPNAPMPGYQQCGEYHVLSAIQKEGYLVLNALGHTSIDIGLGHLVNDISTQAELPHTQVSYSHMMYYVTPPWRPFSFRARETTRISFSERKWDDLLTKCLSALCPQNNYNINSKTGSAQRITSPVAIEIHKGGWGLHPTDLRLSRWQAYRISVFNEPITMTLQRTATDTVSIPTYERHLQRPRVKTCNATHYRSYDIFFLPCAEFIVREPQYEQLIADNRLGAGNQTRKGTLEELLFWKFEREVSDDSRGEELKFLRTKANKIEEKARRGRMRNESS